MVDVKKDVVAELGRWERASLRARFWLRDDDAVTVTDPLMQLGALGQKHDVKIGLAVVPGNLDDRLVTYLQGDGAPRFTPLCHGWTHANYGTHSAPDEFGGLRAADEVLADGEKAHSVFVKSFPDVPAVFVPPYGNLSAQVEPQMRRLGFAAISNSPSLFLQRLARIQSKFAYLPPNPLPVFALDGRCRSSDLNAHIDVIDWRRKTAQTAEIIYAGLLGELRLRRKKYVPASTPIGLLAHHLVHDEAIWERLDELLSFLRSSAAVEFPDLDALVRDAVDGT